MIKSKDSKSAKSKSSKGFDDNSKAEKIDSGEKSPKGTTIPKEDGKHGADAKASKEGAEDDSTSTQKSDGSSSKGSSSAKATKMMDMSMPKKAKGHTKGSDDSSAKESKATKSKFVGIIRIS